ncbi:AI-2E family transporter [Dethiothermospora halolimnae]|uniref:AI-2E family transporter n=1 Tax=Dethiothermospora halolimnae TaxID=3114390 RepID=UPI003CCC0DB2
MNNITRFINEIFIDARKGIRGYIKSQLILMAITFGILTMGFIVIGVPLPILVALGISIIDIIPVVGSGIIMIPWSIISFIFGNGDMGLNIAILYVGLTIFRQIIEPKITGDQIGIRPLYTFGITVLGSIILGPLGIIMAPIIAIIINSIYKVKNNWGNEERR